MSKSRMRPEQRAAFYKELRREGLKQAKQEDPSAVERFIARIRYKR